jgi:hypothetical protein
MTCPDRVALVVDHGFKLARSTNSSQAIFCLRQNATLPSDTFTNEEKPFDRSLTKLKYEAEAIFKTCVLFDTGNIYEIIR